MKKYSRLRNEAAKATVSKHTCKGDVLRHSSEGDILELCEPAVMQPEKAYVMQPSEGVTMKSGGVTMQGLQGKASPNLAPSP